MTLKPFTIKRETVSKTNNPHLKIVDAELITPNGANVTWSYVKTHQAVVIFALDHEQNVFLKREWRLGRKDFVWELPAGFVEEENPTEDQMRSAANRELQEEIGVKAGSLKKLITVYPSNHMSMTSHIYFGSLLEESKLPADEHEYLEIQKLPIDKAYNLLTRQQISNAVTVLAFELVRKKMQK